MILESIPAGFQDIYQGVADEAIENPRIENVVGDSTQAVTQTDPKTVELTVRGNGELAHKTFDLVVDGHIGEGEVALRTTFEYDVVSPDATSISFNKVRREPIPPA